MEVIGISVSKLSSPFSPLFNLFDIPSSLQYFLPIEMTSQNMCVYKYVFMKPYLLRIVRVRKRKIKLILKSGSYKSFHYCSEGFDLSWIKENCLLCWCLVKVLFTKVS